MCCQSLSIFPTPLQQSVRHRPGGHTNTGQGRKIRSQLWETIKGCFSTKGADLRCTRVCGCVCVLNLNTYSFPQVQYLLRGSVIQQKILMWLKDQDKRELQYLLYQWRCVLSLCECTSVYPAVPTVTYFGHLLPDRAGTCLWNSTWGADERERLFFFILKNKTPGNERTHAHLTRLWVLPSFTLTGVESAS